MTRRCVFPTTFSALCALSSAETCPSPVRNALLFYWEHLNDVQNRVVNETELCPGNLQYVQGRCQGFRRSMEGRHCEATLICDEGLTLYSSGICGMATIIPESLSCPSNQYQLVDAECRRLEDVCPPGQFLVEGVCYREVREAPFPTRPRPRLLTEELNIFETSIQSEEADQPKKTASAEQGAEHRYLQYDHSDDDDGFSWRNTQQRYSPRSPEQLTDITMDSSTHIGRRSHYFQPPPSIQEFDVYSSYERILDYDESFGYRGEPLYRDRQRSNEWNDIARQADVDRWGVEHERRSIDRGHLRDGERSFSEESERRRLADAVPTVRRGEPPTWIRRFAVTVREDGSSRQGMATDGDRRHADTDADPVILAKSESLSSNCARVLAKHSLDLVRHAAECMRGEAYSTPANEWVEIQFNQQDASQERNTPQPLPSAPHRRCQSLPLGRSPPPRWPPTPFQPGEVYAVSVSSLDDAIEALRKVLWRPPSPGAAETAEDALRSLIAIKKGGGTLPLATFSFRGVSGVTLILRIEPHHHPHWPPPIHFIADPQPCCDSPPPPTPHPADDDCCCDSGCGCCETTTTTTCEPTTTTTTCEPSTTTTPTCEPTTTTTTCAPITTTTCPPSTTVVPQNIITINLSADSNFSIAQEQGGVSQCASNKGESSRETCTTPCPTCTTPCPTCTTPCPTYTTPCPTCTTPCPTCTTPCPRRRKQPRNPPREEFDIHIDQRSSMDSSSDVDVEGVGEFYRIPEALQAQARNIEHGGEDDFVQNGSSNDPSNYRPDILARINSNRPVSPTPPPIEYKPLFSRGSNNAGGALQWQHGDHFLPPIGFAPRALATELRRRRLQAVEVSAPLAGGGGSGIPWPAVARGQSGQGDAVDLLALAKSPRTPLDVTRCSRGRLVMGMTYRDDVCVSLVAAGVPRLAVVEVVPAAMDCNGCRDAAGRCWHAAIDSPRLRCVGPPVEDP